MNVRQTQHEYSTLICILCYNTLIKHSRNET